MELADSVVLDGKEALGWMTDVRYLWTVTGGVSIGWRRVVVMAVFYL